MSTGVIQRLVKDRGFGFIKSTSGHELFFHQSQLQDAAFDLLREGQTIVFKVGLGPKGLRAINVRLTKGTSDQGN
ncbi:MAG: cold shock domain-containing protein [Dehalococcoidia bacterium]|nr:cold shock domain-containing protein [Dehalococcoidia bacterium]